MPYDRTNENESVESMLGDPEVTEEIENTRKMWSDITGEEKTSEEIIDYWRKDTYVYFFLVIVEDGRAMHESWFQAFETGGRARAEAYNYFPVNEPNTVVELRKHTYAGAKNSGCVQKEGDDAWRPVCFSIELIETIRFN